MTRWEKLSGVLLHILGEQRNVGAALAHVSSALGRLCDTVERIEANEEARHASHQKAHREFATLDARVTRLERERPGAAE